MDTISEEDIEFTDKENKEELELIKSLQINKILVSHRNGQEDLLYISNKNIEDPKLFKRHLV